MFSTFFNKLGQNHEQNFFPFFFLLYSISFKGVLSTHEKKSDDIIQIKISYFDLVSGLNKYILQIRCRSV